jgi:hypothetical protein
MRVFLVTPDPGLPPEVEQALRAGVADAGRELLPDVLPAHAGLAASERARFLALVDRMMEADVLLVDASAPDASVGWCVAWFLARGRLVVLACRRDAREKLATMLAGNPSPWQRSLVYSDAGELRKMLAETLHG